MFGLTALELARIQFGFTISAHIIFPATTNLFAGQVNRRSHLDQMPRGTLRRSKYVRWRAYAQHRACRLLWLFRTLPRVSGAGCPKPRAPKPRYMAPQTNTTFGSTSVGSSYSPSLI